VASWRLGVDATVPDGMLAMAMGFWRWRWRWDAGDGDEMLAMAMGGWRWLTGVLGF